jgi:hypothetical protein
MKMINSPVVRIRTPLHDGQLIWNRCFTVPSSRACALSRSLTTTLIGKGIQVVSEDVSWYTILPDHDLLDNTSTKARETPDLQDALS